MTIEEMIEKLEKYKVNNPNAQVKFNDDGVMVKVTEIYSHNHRGIRTIIIA